MSSLLLLMIYKFIIFILLGIGSILCTDERTFEKGFRVVVSCGILTAAGFLL